MFSEALSALRPVHMSGGSKSLFVVTAEGRVFACGEGTNGRLGLGIGSGGNVSVPRQITALAQYVVKKVCYVYLTSEHFGKLKKSQHEVELPHSVLSLEHLPFTISLLPICYQDPCHYDPFIEASFTTFKLLMAVLSEPN